MQRNEIAIKRPKKLCVADQQPPATYPIARTNIYIIIMKMIFCRVDASTKIIITIGLLFMMTMQITFGFDVQSSIFSPRYIHQCHVLMINVITKPEQADTFTPLPDIMAFRGIFSHPRVTPQTTNPMPRHHMPR